MDRGQDRGQNVAREGRLLQLLLVSTLTSGLELCLAVGTVYLPPLLLQAGLEEHFMTMVLGVGPVLALVFVPLIGSASDGWSGRCGRRLPFVWVLCVGILLALLIIPQASFLASTLQYQRVEVLVLVGGACLLEFCGQACFTLLEALVSDLFPREEDSRWAFAIYSLLLSLGGCVGFLLPAVDWSHDATAQLLGGQEAFVYTILTIVFFVCMLASAFISEERTGAGGVGGVADPRRKSLIRWCSPFRLQPLRVLAGMLLSVVPHLYRLTRGTPAVVWRLFAAELCSWMALESFVLFYTDFMGEGLYSGTASALPESQARLLYDAGVRMASLGLFLQSVMWCVSSLLMERLLLVLGTRGVYLSSVGLMAFSTAVMTVSQSAELVTVMAAATGYTCSTLLVVPYTLNCLYHSEPQVFFPSNSAKQDRHVTKAQPAASTLEPPNINGHPGGMPGTVPTLLQDSPPEASAKRGMGLDIAILNSAYFLSKVLPSLFLGSMVEALGTARAYMGCACALSLMALVLSTRIVFQRQDVPLP
ncbi:solute carrier family 45 member 3 [Denticeps clupeoides]|uniref:Solute carrier family 45 member 3 n=1 Tax=Denticeps clupeoides TaxID=299321 RepID=A0AAY4BYX8_9TELE|nr:solute carrier family 45 member 3-like [Denticeps clupeoides]XP_028854438.1 solute carrier family 45 member 3-like [Denticeps clupeoides]XP_028854439.1 solute carrier family 45 member 3-like [Denticeps clupeoides]XP_028854440.1 solute carrier family 45 member 3-like [Denticeps clupeoides]